MTIETLINLAYVLAAGLFIFGLKLLSHPSTARKGNSVSAVGMFVAVVVTLLDQQIISYHYIFIGILIGGLYGAWKARSVQMTQMPEMVSLFNGFGGAASLLLGWATVSGMDMSSSTYNQAFVFITVLLTLLIGGITFSGSIVAWGKLSGKLSSKAFIFTGLRELSIFHLVAMVALGYLFVAQPTNEIWLYCIIALGLSFGLWATISIGGADMPVVIALLNSYSGIAASAAGLAVGNTILIVTGLLVGASGLILTNIMCKAMNRSLMNVLLSGFAKPIEQGEVITGEIKVLSPQDAFYVLEAAQAVLVVPGYGMAVAQAQHAVRELHTLLEENGCTVDYAIHAVAGRMPGHMNVLLAEADVPYDQLYEMDEVNPRMENYDVVIVIGANDVVNPAAKEMKGSPIYGMPVIEAYRAKTVFVLKRSANAGFAGVDNPLFFKDNTRMILGDAKETINSLIREFGD
ncbi:NAD(P) transhydrogenase subunit beta [Tenacibaculum sp. KUL152]|uniref:NAD(P)(+) transhydrogenase (Re/Si-specific) subunit beta n=1 Tax=Alteromonas sp. KUL106 TaxID=2480799 RepID=UPI0012E631C4|nr:NAD(P)(+) transhydrogenase (Re/Si-specific) subunit beta [Alteromonas sp. KUL106]GFD68687.1 NAD(P) transhydrogenase subunit beta [Alteromonas sp. KUL106]GFD90860.1 NAD(P) transhydrogenase subunit beta [Tenacibaculum sp. KUL152]GFD97290.1 NAD(P) transhydrogenase subunit beta [Alteromonas sp. KUL154]GFE01994.1 NAD(P) transhydrogenase subunit beta [Alteromonas sp. KUL156]